MPYSAMRSMRATRSIPLPLLRPRSLPLRRLAACVLLLLRPLLRRDRRRAAAFRVWGSSNPARRFDAHQLRPVGPEAADRRLGDAMLLVLHRAAPAHLDHGAGVAGALRSLLDHLDRLAILHAHEARRTDQVGRDQPVADHFFVVVLVAEQRLEHLV